MWRSPSALFEGAAVVVTLGCGFPARFVFSARGVALLMQERAENGATTPTWLTLGGPDTEATSEPVAGVAAETPVTYETGRRDHA